MALTLKTGKTIENEYGKYSSAYAVIDKCSGNKSIKEQQFIVDIYKDQQARTDKKVPLLSEPYTVQGDEFDTFFSPEAIAEDNDQYARAYEYIKQLEEVVDSEIVLKYRDWEDA